CKLSNAKIIIDNTFYENSKIYVRRKRKRNEENRSIGSHEDDLRKASKRGLIRTRAIGWPEHVTWRRGEVFSSAPPLFTNEELECIEAQCPCSLLPRHVTRHQHGRRVRSSNVRAIVRHRSFG
ncbi:hypothetical protein V1478_007575, partial [Vespula squamosa]